MPAPVPGPVPAEVPTEAAPVAADPAPADPIVVPQEAVDGRQARREPLTPADAHVLDVPDAAHHSR